ncbi:MAG: hypothetical protein ACUVX8_18090 [Candidatus Zipacnadales bacterium]
MRIRSAMIALLLLVAGVKASPQQHAIQRAVKTSQPAYALAMEVAIPLNDMARAGEIMEQAYEDLFAVATAEGFTPLGEMQIGMPSMMPVEGKIPFQVLLVVIEEPTAEDLAPNATPKIAKIEPQKVAYTYHKGALDQLQMTFFGLFTWIGQQGLEIIGAPRIVIHPNPSGGEPQTAELQIPVK